MKRFVVTSLVAVSALAMAMPAMALTGGTRPQMPAPAEGWIHQSEGGADVLLISTTDVQTSVERALNELGVAYDYYGTYGPFSGVDLSPYGQVILAMDGGLSEDADIRHAADYVRDGGHFHIYGGTCYQPYAIAMNTHLFLNNVNDYCWTTVYGAPDVTITDASNYLAAGLAPTYNFSDQAASYYQLRMTDAGANEAADNADGWPILSWKMIGAGSVDICTNSPYSYYYTFASDYEWLKQVVRNQLFLNPTATEAVTWGTVKALHQ